MVQVKLFGQFRLDTGIKELNVEAKTVRELYPILLSEAKRANPGSTVTAANIDGCVVMINHKQGKKSSKLSNGDAVYLLSPVCGV